MTSEEQRIESYNESRERSHAWFQKKSPAYRAFLELEKQAFRDGALDRKTKELIAVAISIVVKCEPCMEYHVREALGHGATEEEIVEAIEVTFEMGGGPATVQSRFALAALEHWQKK